MHLTQLTPPGSELDFNLCVPDSQDIYVPAGVAGDGDGEPPEPGAGGLEEPCPSQSGAQVGHPDQ